MKSTWFSIIGPVVRQDKRKVEICRLIRNEILQDSLPDHFNEVSRRQHMGCSEIYPYSRPEYFWRAVVIHGQSTSRSIPPTSMMFSTSSVRLYPLRSVTRATPKTRSAGVLDSSSLAMSRHAAARRDGRHEARSSFMTDCVIKYLQQKQHWKTRII